MTAEERRAPESRGDDDVGREPRSLAALVLFIVFLVALLAGFVALGTWQVHRLGLKHELIARVDARVHADPVAPPARAAWPEVTATSDEYRHVRVTGRFLHDKETFTQAATAKGAGFWVLTPLRTADGTLLINRGFVPPKRRDAATRLDGQTPGETVVTGLLRLSEPAGGFLRSNDPAGNRWYSRDVTEIARARGLADAAPFFIDADATPNPGGFPLGGLTVVSFPNNHLSYAVTWYALALMVAGTLIWLCRSELRLRRPGRAR